MEIQSPTFKISFSIAKIRIISDKTKFLSDGIPTNGYFCKKCILKRSDRIPIFRYCKVVFLIITLQPELDLNSREASERINIIQKHEDEAHYYIIIRHVLFKSDPCTGFQRTVYF